MEVETNMPKGNVPSQSGGAEKSPDAASEMKRKAAGSGRMAADSIDESRASAASGLDTAAQKLHQKAGALPGGEKVAGAAHSAAEALASSAHYIREHDVKSTMENLQRLVKNNPGPALFGAALLGFLVARALSRD
jgi:hydroxypyruvate isomerase